MLNPRVKVRMHAKVKRVDVAALFSHLSTLVRAGTPLLEAVLIAAEQTESERMREIVRGIGKSIAAGGSLHAALGEHPRHFRTEWVEVVRSGEETGQLAPILETLVVQMQDSAELRAKLIAALSYPAILLVVAVLSIAVMLVKVVPMFAKMFRDFGKELPGITQGVMAVSEWLQSNGLLLVGAAVVAWLLVRRSLRTPSGRASWDRFHLGVPLLGDMKVQCAMQKFASNLALLLRAGLPLLDALGSVRGIFGASPSYQRAVGLVERRVGAGGAMAIALKETGVFTSFACKMVRIGEESGALPGVLDEVDLLYRRKVMTTTASITRAIETFAILFMGCAVAVILCAIYLPLFSMASGV